jgi:hypothetical protein
MQLRCDEVLMLSSLVPSSQSRGVLQYGVLTFNTLASYRTGKVAFEGDGLLLQPGSVPLTLSCATYTPCQRSCEWFLEKWCRLVEYSSGGHGPDPTTALLTTLSLTSTAGAAVTTSAPGSGLVSRQVASVEMTMRGAVPGRQAAPALTQRVWPLEEAPHDLSQPAVRGELLERRLREREQLQRELIAEPDAHCEHVGSDGLYRVLKRRGPGGQYNWQKYELGRGSEGLVLLGYKPARTEEDDPRFYAVKYTEVGRQAMGLLVTLTC